MLKPHTRLPLGARVPALFDALESRTTLSAGPIIGVFEWGPAPQQHVAAEFYLTVTGQQIPFADTLFAERLRLDQQAADQINRNALDATRQTFGLNAFGAAVIQDGLLLTSRVSISDQSIQPGFGTSPTFPPLATGGVVPIGLGDSADAVADSLRSLTRYAAYLSLTLVDDPNTTDDDVITQTISLADGSLGQITISLPDNLIIVVVAPSSGAGFNAVEQMGAFLLDEFGLWSNS